MIYLITIALATLTCLVGYSLPLYKALDFYGILLAMLSGGYIGVAINDGRRDKLVLELVVALGFCVLVLIGMWKWPILIAGGYFLHAVWDLLHYPIKLGARVKAWFPLAYVIYNGMLGAFIYIHLFH